MRITLAAVCVVAACGGGGEDWTKKPTETVSGKVDGVAFTIEVPKGMRQKAEADELRFDFLVDDRVFTPDIVIREGAFAKTLDDYVKGEPKVASWIRKESLADGYVVSYENPNYKGKEDYLVYAIKTVGDKVLTCSGRVTRWSKDDKVKDKVPALEKVCLSIKPAAG